MDLIQKLFCPNLLIIKLGLAEDMSNFRRSTEDETEDPVDNDFSVLPEVVQYLDVRESVRARIGVQPEKEVSATDEKETVEEFAFGLPFIPSEESYSVQQVNSQSKLREPTSKDKFGPGWLFWAVVLAILVVLAIGLGIGLGLGLPHQT